MNTKSVRLRFSRIDLETHHKKGVSVEVLDVRSREPVFAGTIKSVSAWLEENGFSYIPGTSGWWSTV